MEEQVQQEQPRVPAIEMALDALCNATPKKGEKIHQFVKRCVSVIAGKRERELTQRAIIETLNELGLKAIDPAANAQLALNAEEVQAQ